MSKLHIKKDDTVIVIAGADKGKTGKVLKVLVEENRAIVEGVHMVSKSTKPSAKNPQGGIVKQEAPIHISNLSLIDPKSGKATRVAIKHEGKNVVRIAKKGEPFDLCTEIGNQIIFLVNGQILITQLTKPADKLFFKHRLALIVVGGAGVGDVLSNNGIFACGGYNIKITHTLNSFILKVSLHRYGIVLLAYLTYYGLLSLFLFLIRYISDLRFHQKK